MLLSFVGSYSNLWTVSRTFMVFLSKGFYGSSGNFFFLCGFVGNLHDVAVQGPISFLYMIALTGIALSKSNWKVQIRRTINHHWVKASNLPRKSERFQVRLEMSLGTVTQIE